MAEEELSAPFEKEDQFNSSLNSAQTTDVGKDEAKDDLEGTLQSNHSKEFSFGTTNPAKLPPRKEIDKLALASSRPDPAKLPPGKEIDKLAVASSRPDPAKLPPGEELDELELASYQGEEQGTKATKQPSPIEVSEAEVKRLPSREQVSSPSSECNEAFTFGTTVPLKLPDPALLRQDPALLRQAAYAMESGAKNPEANVASSHGRVDQNVEETAIVPMHPVAYTHTAAARTDQPMQQFQPHPHVPLPPVMEGPPFPSPMPPVTPPDEALSIRSALSGSHRSFQGEVACYAAPPPQQIEVACYAAPPPQQMMMQVPFMPAPHGSGQLSWTPQGWYNPQVFMPNQYATPPVDPYYAAEVSSAPEEFVHQQQIEDEYQDHDYTTSDQAALKTAEYDDPEESAELSLQKLTSAVNIKKRSVAAFFIVVLVVMAAGVVVILVEYK